MQATSPRTQYAFQWFSVPIITSTSLRPLLSRLNKSRLRHWLMRCHNGAHLLCGIIHEVNPALTRRSDLPTLLKRGIFFLRDLPLRGPPLYQLAQLPYIYIPTEPRTIIRQTWRCPHRCHEEAAATTIVPPPAGTSAKQQIRDSDAFSRSTLPGAARRSWIGLLLCTVIFLLQPTTHRTTALHKITSSRGHSKSNLFKVSIMAALTSTRTATCGAKPLPY